jgi:hypothetical protein
VVFTQRRRADLDVMSESKFATTTKINMKHIQRTKLLKMKNDTSLVSLDFSQGNIVDKADLQTCHLTTGLCWEMCYWAILSL